MDLNEYQSEVQSTTTYKRTIREYVEGLGIPDAVKQEQLIELLTLSCSVMSLLSMTGGMAAILHSHLETPHLPVSKVGIDLLKEFNRELLWRVADNSLNVGENLATGAINHLNRIHEQYNEHTD